MRLMIIAALMLAFAGAASAQETTPGEVLHAAVVDVIRPNMLRLDAGARGLDSAMTALCAVPSQDGVAIAAQQFKQVVGAYGRIDFLRIGPLMEDNRADRLLFWPDRRGIGLKQVQAILAEEDATATDLAGLRAKSVAVQGLGALEFVLFGTGAESLTDATGAFRCAYGQAIAGNIAGMAKEMVAGWYVPGGIADHLQSPQPDYADYRSETEAMEALVGLVSHGLEGLRDKHLLPFMASDGGPAKPKLAAFWRAGMTMAFVRANVDGMAELVARSGMARAVGEANRGLDNSIQFEFRNAVRALDLVTLPVEAAVADDKQAAALSYLVLVTGSLQAMVGEQLPTALGLSVGFSSLDGD
ncbi:imelysin family protein [Devosia beringensis]|uniref:imelysin family protein n=1 Tax=Devosia beringensis TaxID=2657486 RepID=UPI00186B5AED|nr:imelysin family protein [Devosia beringensis]